MRSVIALAVGFSLFAGGVMSPALAVRGETGAARDGVILLPISPMEAKNLIETREGLQLVDVRTQQEYLNGALPGSKLVTWSSWSTKDFLRKMEVFDKKRPLLLVCAVGGRSWAAASLLSREGFREVYNLSDGLQAWALQRVPLPQKRADSRQ